MTAPTATTSQDGKGRSKYAVGLLLTSFGTFWAVEGLGYFGSGESLPWPGQDWAIIGLVVGGLGLSRLAVAGLRRTRNTPANQGDVESCVSSSGS